MLGTTNGGQVVATVDEPLQVYLKTKTHKDGWPLYAKDVINTPNIDAHGDFFITVPKSMCSLQPRKICVTQMSTAPLSVYLIIN